MEYSNKRFTIKGTTTEVHYKLYIPESLVSMGVAPSGDMVLCSCAIKWETVHIIKGTCFKRRGFINFNDGAADFIEEDRSEVSQGSLAVREFMYSIKQLEEVNYFRLIQIMEDL